MATLPELNTKIDELNAKVATLQTSITTLINEMSAAFGRLLAKIEAGPEVQAEMDKLLAMGSTLNDIEAQVQSGTDQARLEGQ